MRLRLPRLLAVTTLAAALCLAPADRARAPGAREPGEARGGSYPSDWFERQRAYPFATINQRGYVAAVEQARFERAALARAAAARGPGAARAAEPAALSWQPAGPYNSGGRITAIAVTPGAGAIYVGSANGGVFKSTNGGVNFTPIFDAVGVVSIGALALDLGTPARLYVGTGEANSSGDSYDGAGLFRSSDGGASWTGLGLEATRRIARVAVDPLNTSRIFVAAMGTQSTTGPERGLYRSQDAGQSWQKVLFVSDSTGACDVAINPAHPETVFCATWERVRRYTYRRAYGPECGIWRSADHGATWTLLAGGLPAPSDAVSRIGLAIAPSRPSTVYAQIIGQSGDSYPGLGLYRSLDGGVTWTRRDLGTFTSNFGGFGWYFGDVVVDPTNPNLIYSLGVNLVRSTDGGATYSFVTPGHVDQHALWIDPSNASRIYAGCDGGCFSSTDAALSWTMSVDLPITQFYAGTIDPSNPARLLGGTQDNGTVATSGSPTAWSSILGGDGFQCLVDPTNASILFAEWQYCCDHGGPRRSTNGGGSWSAPAGISSGDRFNWMTPIAMDPQNHNVLLVGSERVYKSTDNGLSYSAVSGDLTTNPGSPLVFGTLSTLAVSPASSSVYYAGTDDGRVWRSLNAGANWTEISAGLPVRWVTRVTPDPADAAAVYVTLSGFGQGEQLAHVYRSADHGDTWTSISGGLPDAPANDLVVDPADPNTLFLATDVGVYLTRTRGAGWAPLGTGMPIQAVFDLSFEPISRALVAATHGRSQWKLDLTTWTAGVPAAGQSPRLALGPPVPNPSRGPVEFALEVTGASRTEVEIYDAAGRLVRALHPGLAIAGPMALEWDGLDERGRRAAPGVYFARVSAGGAASVRRLVRLE